MLLLDLTDPQSPTVVPVLVLGGLGLGKRRDVPKGPAHLGWHGR